MVVILFIALTTSGIVTQFNENKTNDFTFIKIIFDCVLLVIAQITIFFMIKIEKDINKL